MMSNYAQGLAASGGDGEIAANIYDHYTASFGDVALEAELSILESLVVPATEECRCISTVRTAPEVFSRSMTQ